MEKKLRKFNSKEMLRFISNECNNLNTDDLCEMQRGLAEFFKIFSKYQDSIYGSNKRYIDLFQYASLISSITIRRIKEEEELPY